jgi:hypothetical protein
MLFFKMRCDGIEERLYDERRVELGIVPAKGDRHFFVRDVPDCATKAGDCTSMAEDLMSRDLEPRDAEAIPEPSSAPLAQLRAEVGHLSERLCLKQVRVALGPAAKSGTAIG